MLKHTKRQVNEFCFPKCVLLSCFSPQFVCYFLLSYDGQRKRVFAIYFIGLQLRDVPARNQSPQQNRHNFLAYMYFRQTETQARRARNTSNTQEKEHKLPHTSVQTVPPPDTPQMTNQSQRYYRTLDFCIINLYGDQRRLFV